MRPYSVDVRGLSYTQFMPMCIRWCIFTVSLKVFLPADRSKGVIMIRKLCDVALGFHCFGTFF